MLCLLKRQEFKHFTVAGFSYREDLGVKNIFSSKRLVLSSNKTFGSMFLNLQGY
jgi:hypothetical protein